MRPGSGAPLRMVRWGGLPQVQVVDLRAATPPAEPQRSNAPASGLPARIGAVSGLPSSQGPFVYIVRSAEQASMLQQGIDEGDGIRYQMGLAPLDATVVQIDPGTPEAMLRTVADLNAVRYTLGLPDVQVVDLR